MKKYDLIPVSGQKSFYGKAQVVVDEFGNETLVSYGTQILIRFTDGTYQRLFDGTTKDGYNVGITATTLKHIRAFCGMNKKQFLNLEY